MYGPSRADLLTKDVRFSIKPIPSRFAKHCGWKSTRMVQSVFECIDSSRPSDSTKEWIGHWYSLVQWDDVPHWQQDNHHIHGSYRKPSASYYRSLASLFYIHNETVNIYSHLLPALTTLPGAFSLYKSLQPRYPRATNSDLIAFGCFFLGAAMCLGMSATYHTISNHSPRVNKLGNQLDYAGIVLLISGSFVPSVYYGFWCEPTWQKVYWTMVGWI